MGQPPCLLARGCQPFPPSVVTTFTQVPSRGYAPFVSIGRRGSPDGPFGSGHRIHCQRASHPQPCHDWTQAAYPSYHSQVRLFKQLLDKRTGALPELPLDEHSCITPNKRKDKPHVPRTSSPKLFLEGCAIQRDELPNICYTVR
jgi:hypothetical protein